MYISHILKQAFQSHFIKNVLLIASGTASAQAIGMLAMPFITRLYGPEAFGISGAFIAVGSSLIPIAALTYPIAIVLAENNAEAKEIGVMSILISFSIALLTYLFFILYGGTLITVLNLQTIGNYIYLIPILIIFSAILQVARQWSIRKNNYKRIATATIIQSVFINISKLAIGFISPTAFVLIITYVIGQFLQAVLLLLRDIGTFTQQISMMRWQHVKYLAKKYYDFPLYRAPQVALNAFSESMPLLFFSTFYGPTTAGFYSLARIALGIPASLIGQSVSDVFYPRFVKAYQTKQMLKPLLVKATFVLAIIGFLPYFLIFIIGPWFFSFVFGTEWGIAGEFARWISLWLFATLFTRPIISAIPILKMQQIFLIFEIISLLLRFFILYIGYKVFHLLETANIAILSITNMVLFIILTIVVIWQAKATQGK